MSALLNPKTPDFASARRTMVECQLRPNRVQDEGVLCAMETLPREIFVPAALSGIAYCDEDLQVAENRYLLEPMILARLLQEAHINAEDHVLDLAPATGYSTAVIASYAKDVVAVESDEALQKQAAANLHALQIKNAEIRLGSPTEGCKAQAPYDVIVINGGVETLPDELLAQLAEGGRLVVVMLNYAASRTVCVGESRLYEKLHGNVSHRALFNANVHPVPAFEAPQRFTFEIA